MQDSIRDHWDHIYRTTDPTKVGWFQQYPEASLNLIASIGLGKQSPIIDAGGGASRLVDELLKRGFENLTVLDISPTSLDMAKSRLKHLAGRVNWIVDDLAEFSPPHEYEVWHDRAVFHFLTEPDDRERYVRVLEQSLAPGGQFVIGVFGPNGPRRCSGLDVLNYSPGSLSEVLPQSFELLENVTEIHWTPEGVAQEYLFCHFRRSIH